MFTFKKCFLVMVFASCMTSQLAQAMDTGFREVANCALGAAATAGGWLFFAAKGASWGRPALALFLCSSTGKFLVNDVTNVLSPEQLSAAQAFMCAMAESFPPLDTNPFV